MIRKKSGRNSLPRWMVEGEILVSTERNVSRFYNFIKRACAFRHRKRRRSFPSFSPSSPFSLGKLLCEFGAHKNTFPALPQTPRRSRDTFVQHQKTLRHEAGSRCLIVKYLFDSFYCSSYFPFAFFFSFPIIYVTVFRCTRQIERVARQS